MWFRNECRLRSRVPVHQHVLSNVLVPSSERMTSLFLENEKKLLGKNWILCTVQHSISIFLNPQFWPGNILLPESKTFSVLLAFLGKNTIHMCCLKCFNTLPWTVPGLGHSHLACTAQEALGIFSACPEGSRWMIEAVSCTLSNAKNEFKCIVLSPC